MLEFEVPNCQLMPYPNNEIQTFEKIQLKGVSIIRSEKGFRIFKVISKERLIFAVETTLYILEEKTNIQTKISLKKLSGPYLINFLEELPNEQILIGTTAAIVIIDIQSKRIICNKIFPVNMIQSIHLLNNNDILITSFFLQEIWNYNKELTLVSSKKSIDYFCPWTHKMKKYDYIIFFTKDIYSAYFVFWNISARQREFSIISRKIFDYAPFALEIENDNVLLRNVESIFVINMKKKDVQKIIWNIPFIKDIYYMGRINDSYIISGTKAQEYYLININTGKYSKMNIISLESNDNLHLIYRELQSIISRFQNKVFIVQEYCIYSFMLINL